MYKVIAIIVTYNPDPDLLYRQFKSILDQVEKIIYVDNNSPNLDFSMVDYDKVDLICNKENKGLGYAQNQGIEQAIKQDATHIILFDQDTIADSSLINELIKTSNEYDNVVLVGPAIYNNYTMPPTISDTVSKLSWKISKQEMQNYPIEVEYCIASGSLISVNGIKEVGLINDKLFIDALDLEWCLRAKYKGYKIMVNPKAKVYHQLGNGLSDRILSHTSSREFYICRNNILLARMKHIPYGYRLRKILLTPLRPLTSLLRGRLDYFNSGVRGILNAFINK